MARTVKDYINAASYAAGVAEFDGRLDPLNFLNDAGEYLYRMHAWSFRERATADLDFVQDQPHVALPSDFGELRAVARLNEGCLHSVTPVDLTVLEHMRQRQPRTATDFFVAVEQPGQTDAAAAMPAPRLAIYPEPAEDVSGALRLVYRAKWRTIAENMTHVPGVPADVEWLLEELVRVHAVALVQRRSVDELLRPVLEGRRLSDLKTRYGLTAVTRQLPRPSVVNVYDELRVPGAPRVDSITLPTV